MILRLSFIDNVDNLNIDITYELNNLFMKIFSIFIF